VGSSDESVLTEVFSADFPGGDLVSYFPPRELRFRGVAAPTASPSSAPSVLASRPDPLIPRRWATSYPFHS